MSAPAEGSGPRRWFVYCGMEYYPWAQVFEADTAEEAAAAARETGDSAGSGTNYPVAVFPLEALAYRRDGGAASDWLDPDPPSLR